MESQITIVSPKEINISTRDREWKKKRPYTRRIWLGIPTMCFFFWSVLFGIIVRISCLFWFICNFFFTYIVFSPIRIHSSFLSYTCRIFKIVAWELFFHAPAFIPFFVSEYVCVCVCVPSDLLHLHPLHRRRKNTFIVCLYSDLTPIEFCVKRLYGKLTSKFRCMWTISMDIVHWFIRSANPVFWYGVTFFFFFYFSLTLVYWLCRFCFHTIEHIHTI